HRDRRRHVGRRPLAQWRRLADQQREVGDRGRRSLAITTSLKRRRLLQGAAAASLAGAARARAQAGSRILIRGAYLLTMDPALGDIPSGDILVEDGRIVGVGPTLQGKGGQVIEAAGMVAMPGFVDTHWHMWNSLLRGLVGGTPQTGY